MVEQIFEVATDILSSAKVSEHDIKQSIPISLKDLNGKNGEKQSYPDFYGINDYLSSVFKLLQVDKYGCVTFTLLLYALKSKVFKKI